MLDNTNPLHVASCNCISKKWKDSMPYITSIYFQRSIFDHLSNGQTPDNIISTIMSSSCRLEELVVYFPFTSAGLASWLLLVGSSLKNLELRMDNLADQNASNDSLAKLECF
ncbi:F-box domain, Leucine-rich repeat domain, L domain-like protein [Artemisia annua]|uniref:F-box domain, Leucine-rich repeat domain, L domain-like protein n=1 Tax=Artemisia annua TaxID=35608 RepID=A0A2U1MGR2_ARTAN|nr:F-box domain, Leucine-rich repeat domain, L domain-like protein [Artemisia annua]